MTTEIKKTQITIELDNPILELLQSYGKDAGTSISSMINTIVGGYIFQAWQEVKSERENKIEH